METNYEKSINQSDNNDYDVYEGITHLKLQKLLYFANGICLAETGEPLFSDKIEAWSYGPVVKSVYDEFKKFGRQPLELKDISDEEKKVIIDKVVQNSKIRKILDFVYKNYAVYTAWKLVEMAHEKGSPWDITMEKNKGERGIIGNSLIKDYFVREIIE